MIRSQVLMMIPFRVLMMIIRGGVMRVILVSRHAGLVEWVKNKGFVVDKHFTHLDVKDVQNGDVIIGTLPVQMIASICKKGAKYYHLEITLPEALRGKELSASKLDKLGADLVSYKAVIDES